eukprot:706361_1
MVHINSATPPKGRRFTFPGIKNSWMLMADGKWEYVQRKPGRGQIQIKPNTSEPSDWYVRWKGFYKTKKDFQGVVEQGETEEQRKKHIQDNCKDWIWGVNGSGSGELRTRKERREIVHQKMFQNIKNRRQNIQKGIPIITRIVMRTKRK